MRSFVELFARRSVRLKLQRGEITLSAEQYDSATVYFSDVSDFAEISDTHNPMQIVIILNEIYRCEICRQIAEILRRAYSMTAVWRCSSSWQKLSLSAGSRLTLCT